MFHGSLSAVQVNQSYWGTEARPLHVFISAGEPSGDLHGANLAKALKLLDPAINLSGLGGDRMVATGIEPLVHIRELSVVGFLMVAQRFFDLTRYLDKVRRFFYKHRPDVVVLIDFPGFNWWVAAKAREFGIPVVYFVPPQLWAWGSWRVAKMRRLVDRVLCNFPFEEAWYRQQGVDAILIGHPYFDELKSRHVDQAQVKAIQSVGGPVVGILPGSRDQELEYNLGSQLDAARRISSKFPSAQFHVACFHAEHAAHVAEQLNGPFSTLPVTIHSGKTPEVIAAADMTICVSGSVSLELLQAGVPSIMIYQGKWHMMLIARTLMRCKFISLPNLIADEELFPEFIGHTPLGEALANRACQWLAHPDEMRVLRTKLIDLWNKTARPGACDRAAVEIVAMAGKKKQIKG